MTRVTRVKRVKRVTRVKSGGKWWNVVKRGEKGVEGVWKGVIMWWKW